MQLAVRIKGQQYGYFATTFEHGGESYLATWLQWGGRVFAEHHYRRSGRRLHHLDEHARAVLFAPPVLPSVG